jgi:cobalt-zinc-cadmium efflux system protein
VGAGVEALTHLWVDNTVNSKIVVLIAGLGIAINGGSAFLLSRYQKDDHNIRVMFLHLFYDLLISTGVVIAGIIMWFTQLFWIDSLISLLIVCFILKSSWQLLQTTLNGVLDAVPTHIDIFDIEHFFRQTPGVITIHDLHVWALSSQEIALTAHVISADFQNTDRLLKILREGIVKNFGITHITLQIEKSKEPCEGSC